MNKMNRGAKYVYDEFVDGKPEDGEVNGWPISVFVGMIRYLHENEFPMTFFKQTRSHHGYLQCFSCKNHTDIIFNIYYRLNKDFSPLGMLNSRGNHCLCCNECAKEYEKVLSKVPTYDELRKVGDK